MQIQNGCISKFQLIDTDGETVVQWSSQSIVEGKEWEITRDIPEDKEIIGIYCNTSYHTHYINKLGFILWTPNPFAV